MANNKTVISFIGGHDLDSANAAIVQIINYLKPAELYLFVTKEFEQKAEEYEKELQNHTTAKINMIKTGIENPTNQKEIHEKIQTYLKAINDKVVSNKDLGYINLTSGTPDMKCVFAILLALKQMPRFSGIYAPNPKYDTQVRIDNLAFYKNKLSENTIKRLIAKYDYQALCDLIIQKELAGLDISEEFKELANFANNRFIGNMEQAEKIYNETEYLKNNFEFSKPANLYEKAVEAYYSVDKIIKNKDYFQSTLKLGVIRENLLKYINDKLLGGYETIADKTDKQKDNEYKWDLEKLEKNEPKLKEYIVEQQSKSKSSLRQYDFNREINAHTDKMILEYLAKYKYFGDSNIANILKNFNCLEELTKQRNTLAHTLSFGTNKVESWTKNVGKILFLTEKYFNDSKFDQSNIYDKINEKLTELL